MLEWFEKTAPIRKKFDFMVSIYGALFGANVLVTWLASTGALGPGAALATAGATGVVGVIFMLVAKDRICRPYVNTVVRMEALAAGDTDSPIDYADYSDCVGRMTRAMSVFRDNAVKLAHSKVAQAAHVCERLVPSFETLARGDLTHKMPEDALGDGFEALPKSFNETVDKLSHIISDLRASAQRVDTGSDEIRAASDDLATRNEQQAASLEETAASMRQVTELVKKSAENARVAQESMLTTHRQATNGGEVVSRAVSAMASIESSSQEITQIIDVIDGIAFQTNLLALNAGVEAARAGDAGKGFAVVANEVRALAQRSAEAARDIKQLISTSTSHVGEGVTLVGETGTLLEAIVEQIGNVTTQVDDIATMATSQANNLEQVNNSVGAMDQMTQRNAAMVEETTAAARSLADEAKRLEQMVGQFRINAENVHDWSAAPAAPVRHAARAAPAPATMGNLALKQDFAPAPDEQDWSEF